MKRCFSNKLQELRKKNGLSQEALAEILEVSRQSVSKWESGQVYPEIDKIIFLSEYFHVSIDELLIENVQPKKNYINLSKSVQTKKIPPVMEQEDIMPQGYQIPPVQPRIQPSADNVNVVDNNKLKKKIIIHKTNLSKLTIAIIGIIISYITAACIEIYSNTPEPDYSITLEENHTLTTIAVIDDNVVHSYEYNPYEILNKIYYYYDKNEKKYIEVLLPIEPYCLDSTYDNSYDIQIVNIYLESFEAYLDVVILNDTTQNINYMRYYSDEFGKYINVIIPESFDICELEYYGYKIVDVYEDGKLYKTIINDN